MNKTLERTKPYLKLIITLLLVIFIINLVGLTTAITIFILISIGVVYIYWEKYKHAVNYFKKEIQRITAAQKKNGKNKRH